jgi:3-oxoacyl-(acyl-carrier-protein) synthase
MISPSQVEAINAWGPGHPKIDAAEVLALRSVFGGALDYIPAVSIKGALGNALAAAPAIQVACAALSMRNGIVPPTVNWQHCDPDCDLSLSNSARMLPHRISVVDAHGLSGMNSAMILERCN